MTNSDQDEDQAAQNEDQAAQKARKDKQFKILLAVVVVLTVCFGLVMLAGLSALSNIDGN